MFTDLIDRQLWYDGDSVVPQSKLIELLQRGVSTKCLCVDELNKDIIEYNQYASPAERVLVKKELKPLDLNWNLPLHYSHMDVKALIDSKFFDEAALRNWGDDEVMQRYERVRIELTEFNRINRTDVLRAIIYIVDTFTQDNVVWGVGRGSSVSSYVLYLIGIHDIDSYKYDLDFADFIRS